MDISDDISSTHSSFTGGTKQVPELPDIQAPRGHRQRMRDPGNVQRALRGHTVRTRGGRGANRMIANCDIRTRDGRACQCHVQGHGRVHIHDRQHQVAPVDHGDNADDGRQQEARPNAWVWTDTMPNGNYRPRDIPFQGDVGLALPIPQDAQTIDFFKLYFTREIIDKIVQETNRYAEQFIRANDGNIRRALVKLWKPTTPEEM